MNHKVFFFLMAFVQAIFAIRGLHSPEAAKSVNVKMKTIWSRMPLAFFRAVGAVCACAAILFLYMAMKPSQH